MPVSTFCQSYFSIFTLYVSGMMYIEMVLTTIIATM